MCRRTSNCWIPFLCFKTIPLINVNSLPPKKGQLDTIYYDIFVISAISIPSMLVIFAYYASANTAGSRELRGSRGGKQGAGSPDRVWFSWC